jgi:excisionase family DNA binding protein
MYAKVSEIAERFRVSRDTVYFWIRTQVIPERCIDRVGATIRIDSDQFETLLREKKLSRPRAATRVPAAREEVTHAVAAADSFTTVGVGPSSEHQWISEAGKVQPEHPYSPEMVAVEK